MGNIVDLDKEQLLSLLRQYRMLITEHLNLTNKTIAFSQEIQKLLIALEKYEDDFAVQLPNEDMKFRDSLRQIHKALKAYFSPKKAKLEKHFHGLTQQNKNCMAYVQILGHHVAKTSRNLKAQVEGNTKEIPKLIEKDLQKLVRAEQACRAGYKCIKLEVKEAQRLIHELHNEFSPVKKKVKKNELRETHAHAPELAVAMKSKESPQKKIEKELASGRLSQHVFEYIMKHTPDFLTSVEKAEIQDLFNHLGRLELKREGAHFDEENQHELMHLVNENQRKSEALQLELNTWLKKQEELELQMQRVYVPEPQVHKPKVFTLSMDPRNHFNF